MRPAYLIACVGFTCLISRASAQTPLFLNLTACFSKSSPDIEVSRRDRQREDDGHHPDRWYRAEWSPYGARETQLPGERSRREQSRSSSGMRWLLRCSRTCLKVTSIRLPATCASPERSRHRRMSSPKARSRLRRRSFKQHGFLDVALIGDSGGNQAGQQLVAEALNKEWAARNVRVHRRHRLLSWTRDDWRCQPGRQRRGRRLTRATHDTSSLMYLNPSMLRFDRMAGRLRQIRQTGSHRNPARATALFGQHILEMQVEDAVKQIQALRVNSRR